MPEHTQTYGCGFFPPAGRKPRTALLDGGFRLACVWGLVCVWLLPVSGWAQTLRLGLMDLTVSARGDVVYDSNVDGVYPEEENPELYQEDLYLMPGLMITSESVPMRPNTTFRMQGNLSYMDYLKRNDLDTELYSGNVSFQTIHPRLTLGGMLLTEYSVDGELDKYMPGGVSRDPMRSDSLSGYLNWNYWKLRLQSSADLTRERHDYPMFQMDDNDKTTLSASFYLDVFTWGSLYYTWEDVTTTYVETEEETQENTTTMGIMGNLPLEVLRHPRVSYALGLSYEDKQVNDDENEKTWKPIHNLTVADEYQLTKAITLSGNATWQNSPGEDDVTFLYDLRLAQLLGTHAEHGFVFMQEPRPTFGSTSDTETTTYKYFFRVNNLLIRNLSASLDTAFEESTPLEEENAETEKTTTININVTHRRQLTRKLQRILSYIYTSENSNFHHNGANERHLLTYGFTYTF